jgi:aryl-phospho-beta-D-glucosidase BglC (GH1 family)
MAIFNALVLCLLPLNLSAQFAHTSRKQIVDARGKPFLIRGTNLGNWLVPEGYMWNFEGGPQSVGEIENLVVELLGPEKSAAFWHQYRDQYVTRQDIHLLHEAGFNTIRIPLHYKFFETDSSEGFVLLDRVLQWSRQEGLYVILDMHAAPGGQTGANIDDSYGYPWLYDSLQEQAHLIAVWQRLARRYANNPTVLGYDLLNEPIPHFPALAPLNPKLEPLYKKLTAAIRQIDAHHILFLGGAQWDGNFAVFGQPFDSNTAYTFHKYWTSTDESVIRPYLDFRDKYNVPLWMGESGENTDEWITQFVALLNRNDIGWTFWPYKKMVKSSAIATIKPPAGWDKIVAFAKLPRGTGQVEERLKVRPDQETINRAFASFLENVQLQHCQINAGYLQALGMKSPSIAP